MLFNAHMQSSLNVLTNNNRTNHPIAILTMQSSVQFTLMHFHSPLPGTHDACMHDAYTCQRERTWIFSLNIVFSFNTKMKLSHELKSFLDIFVDI